MCKRVLLWIALLALPLTAARAESIRIAYIVPSYSEIVFWSDIEDSMRRAAEELDVDLIPLYTKHEVANLELGLNDALSIAIYSDADAIITSYTLADEGTDAVLAEALERSIPVVMIDCDGPEPLRTAYIGIDNMAAAREIGDLALDGMADSECALLVYSQTCPERKNLMERITGVRQAFAAENGRLQEFAIGQFAVQTVLDLRQLIQTEPSITAVIAINENSTLECAQALSGAGMDSVKLYGFDESKDTLALLDSGAIEALASQAHSEMGYQSVVAARALISGDASASGIRRIDFAILHSGGTAQEPESK